MKTELIKSQANKIIRNNELDLLALVRFLWSIRFHIARVTLLFVILGLIVAFTNPVEYEAQTKLLPEVQESEGPKLTGGLGSLAGIAGIDLSSGPAGSMSTTLYPEIVKSLPFVLKLMNDSIYFENIELTTTSIDYLENYASRSLLDYIYLYTIGLPSIVKNLIVNSFFEEKVIEIDHPNEFYRLSKEQMAYIEDFRNRVLLSIDETTGLIVISVKMQDAFASAQLAKKIELQVTSEVIKYKTNKARENLEFIKASFFDAKQRFENVQLQLAQVTDKNLNVTSTTARIKLKSLQNEYDVAFDVYKGLASQVEQAKLKLKNDTPVFTILEPVKVPVEKSEPKRLVILLSFTFIGVLFALLVSLSRVVWLNINEEKVKA